MCFNPITSQIFHNTIVQFIAAYLGFWKIWDGNLFMVIGPEIVRTEKIPSADRLIWKHQLGVLFSRFRTGIARIGLMGSAVHVKRQRVRKFNSVKHDCRNEPHLMYVKFFTVAHMFKFDCLIRSTAHFNFDIRFNVPRERILKRRIAGILFAIDVYCPRSGRHCFGYRSVGRKRDFLAFVIL